MRTVPWKLGSWLLCIGIAGVVSCGDDSPSFEPGGESGGEGGEGLTDSGGSSSGGKGGSSSGGKGGTSENGGSNANGGAEDGGTAGVPSSGGSSSGGEAGNGGSAGSAPQGGEGGTEPLGGQGGEGGNVPVGGEGGEGGTPPVSCEDEGGCYDNDPCTVDLCPDTFCAYEPVTCSELEGGTGGTAITDLCPDGQVVIGYEGHFNNGNVNSYANVITRLTTICGTPSVPAADGPVTIASGATLTTRGSLNTTPWSRTCPTDQVVVGFAGSAFTFLTDLVLYCAPLSVTDGQIAVGTSSALPEITAFEAGDPFDLAGCPAGEVARGSAIRSGDVIDGFGVVCSTLPASP